ncbi:MAG: hypothetical protein WA660_06815, partial [Candidatus Acidiferrales bacterium]
MPKKKTKKRQRKNAAAKSLARSRKSSGPTRVKNDARGGRGTDPARVRAILQGLDEAYPDAVCELGHENP